jgi:hypothetical protein
MLGVAVSLICAYLTLQFSLLEGANDVAAEEKTTAGKS